MYALVDCNNFYASCERVFNPLLEGEPVAILSNNDGCVISRSDEAKPFVPMAAPAYKYEEEFKKNNIHVFSSNYPLYGSMSNRVMNILNTFTPDLEIYSIDEAFLHFKGFEDCDFYSSGIEMREKVKKYTGMPISVGFAPTKALSKVANKIARKFPEKTSGCYVIDSEEKRIKALKWIKIEDVWGIGRQISKKLIYKGINNAYEFTQLPDDFVRREFSIVALRLKQELQGTSTLTLDEISQKKSIATTRTFERSVKDFQDVKERISTFSSSCGEKLRKQRSYCNAIMVFIKTNTHKKDQNQYRNGIVVSLPYPTNSDITLSQYANIALQSIFQEGYRYKKAGVVVLDLVPQEDFQLNLFVNEDARHFKLMKTMDKLNRKMGEKKVKLGSQDLKKTWKMKQDRLSPKYTTNWNQLLEVL
ncbi:Y-family DNA polymerase [Moheibacter sediminis]|uniref:DNA polymerase V n=1 Tax=Moheibacter sediminis TaxID=1434700 RepID=A0A1W2C963_9FLAO|nr:Y-family DNA polymerase [Moheibacter sediminis]SMC81524.1 DNA polymerase V [Moheibacter sediminis]